MKNVVGGGGRNWAILSASDTVWSRILSFKVMECVSSQSYSAVRWPGARKT